MKFRKRPVEIEAVQYAGNGNMVDRSNVPDWLWDAFATGVARSTDGADPLVIQTKEGELVCSPGDWIIRGVQGELYPCKPDVFEQTYDEVEETDALLPCPFCGVIPDGPDDVTGGASATPYYAVACYGCNYNLESDHTEEAAIERWNRRAGQAAA